MKRILIVEDETLIRYGMTRALQDDETEVKAVQDGEEAISEAAARFYDLCFLDIFLPDSNGIDIMKKIKDISPETKVIIMSAGVIRDTEQNAIKDCAYLFISKPFDLHQVKSITQKALHK